MRLPGFVGSAAASSCFSIAAAAVPAQSSVAVASVSRTLDETSIFEPKVTLTCASNL